MEFPLFLHHAFFTISLCFSIFMGSLNTVISMKENISGSSSPFPTNFLFGTATSSYQNEGAFLSDGKGLSNWDVFSHKPGTIIDGSNGDVAADGYHRYQEDADLMEHIGVNSYRFSISWARILPKGRFGKVNMAGIDYYNRLINVITHKGIEPFVTLVHYDIPQELEDRYKSWLSPEVQEDFKYYANICFKHFGERVKYWVTFNEPKVQSIRGYKMGTFPPSHCSAPYGNCSDGDSGKEPFIAAHNLILSHASVVNLYRTKYQEKQGGKIGIVINTPWYEPFSNSTQDKLAAQRALSFTMNWILDPIILGRYPSEMVEIIGHDLPEFSSKDIEMLKNGLDFIGVNHYTSYYAKDCIFSASEAGYGCSKYEGFSFPTLERNGIFIGEKTEVDWMAVYPQGMEKIVTYIKERYNNLPIYITENGYPSIGDTLNDVKRVEYLEAYLNALVTAIRKGADVRGYFVWTLLDNFEWTDGYTTKFGLHHVDYDTLSLNRTTRLSAIWYKHFIAQHTPTRLQVIATQDSISGKSSEMN